MGDRNLGSESLYGQNENFENFKTAVNWTPRVELSSSLGNINLYYKSHFLRRFLEIRLSVFFGKKSEIFKTHYENFERGLEVRRGDKASEKERKKKSRSKTLLFFFFFFFFAKIGPIFSRLLRSPGACNSAGHHSGLPDWTLLVLKWPKIAKKCPKEAI